MNKRILMFGGGAIALVAIALVAVVAVQLLRSDDPNLGQLLHLMNNSGINARIASKDGRVSKLIESKRTNLQVVQELYLATFSRYPTSAELKLRVATLDKSKDRKQAAEDLLWALVNSKEFIFNH